MTTRKALFFAVSVSLMLVVLAAGVYAQVGQKDSVYKYLSIFTEVFKLVRDNYVEDVPPQKLVNGAFSGVTDAIDEFSYYVPPADMPQYKNYVEEDGTGSGLVVTKRFGYGFVVAPVPGSSAKEAGIQAGDFIEKINGSPTQPMQIWQIRQALKGTDGKPVHLTVIRGGMTKRDEITVTPGKINAQPITLEQMGDVAYVKLPYFSKGSADQFKQALDSASKKGDRKLIVDIRGNAGGAIEEAVAAADALLTSGAISSIAGRRAEKTAWSADRAESFGGDVLVLTDNSTSGSAEVFAGAITGNQRGKTVGVPTYGRAIVQRLVNLPSGGALYLTVAHYTMPDGKPIKEQGIRPDINVDLSPLALRDPNAPGKAPDLILEKAISVFNGNSQQQKAAA